MGLKRANQTSFHKGDTPWNKGKKGVMPPQCGFQKGHKTNLGKQFVLGKHWKVENKKSSMGMLGKRHLKVTKRKMSLSHGGTGIPVRPTKRYYHLQDRKYCAWRTTVFARDNYTCQKCGAKGYIEPHHIKGWSKYPKLRYEVKNGITLCKDCHILTRRRKN